MHAGLMASLVLHAVLLGWALLAIITAPPLSMPKPEPVEVAIISPDDLVRLKQGDRQAKNLEAETKTGTAKEPPKKETPKPVPTPPPPAAAPPPPAAEAKAEPPPPNPEPAKPEPPKPDPIEQKLAALPPPEPTPTPGPTPDDQKKLEETLKEQERAAAAKAASDAKAAADAKAKADAKTKADALAKAAKAKALADAKAKADAKKDLSSVVEDALKNASEPAQPKALIDKTPPKGGPQVAAKSDTPSKAKGPTAGAPEGKDDRITASQASMLGTLMKQAVSRCWNINAGLEGIDKLIVKVEIKLGQDGRLIGEPRVTNSAAGPQFQDAANSAVRALIQCQPYTNLPPDLYTGGWDFMALTFDPRQMF